MAGPLLPVLDILDSRVRGSVDQQVSMRLPDCEDANGGPTRLHVEVLVLMSLTKPTAILLLRSNLTERRPAGRCGLRSAYAR